MTAVGGVSQYTLVNSVFPAMQHCLHREGPVVVSTTNTVVAACREFTNAARSQQSAAGKRNADNLIRWDKVGFSAKIGARSSGSYSLRVGRHECRTD